ncbi:MAG: TlpA family protein disulfide reductase [Paracoccaceae bacterium]
MAFLRSAVLYTALILGANLCLSLSAALSSARAEGVDRAALDALRLGDMAKLVLAETPAAVPDIPFLGPDGAEHRLADWQGKVVLVNFWATWCAPCREEMPSLARLQAALGGERFAVLTIATGRNPPAAIDRFFEETGVTDLPRYADPKMELARGMGVLGLPVTVLIGPDGAEIGRLIGGAAWDRPEAVALLRAAMGG